ncbi:MAG: hypothetical protein D6729_12490 [Deltaproteobacteria bacterium]|nr:MAG: hypothetical protein D6729_12490 [Deltaproteobacteria bacterium]
MNVIGLLLLAGLIGGGYFLYVYAPLFLDNLDAKSECEKALNETWRYKDPEVTRERFVRNVRRVRTIEVEDEGVVEEVPAIDPEPEDVYVELDETVEPPMLRLDYSYTRTVTAPLLNKQWSFDFSVHCEQDTGAVKY